MLGDRKGQPQRWIGAQRELLGEKEGAGNGNGRRTAAEAVTSEEG